MPPKKRTEKWSQDHKAKFRRLIQQRKINPTIVDPEYIDSIGEQYWPNRPQATFRNNYKASVREYKIGLALNEANEARKTRAAARNGEFFLGWLLLVSFITHDSFLVAAAAEPPDEEEDDESYVSANEEAVDDEEEEEALDDEGELIDQDELQGLEEDLKMPATTRSKKSLTPPRTPPRSARQSATADELTILAKGMTISDSTSEWYSPNQSFPYVIYAYKDEINPVQHMCVDILMPGIPDDYLRKIEVLPCGKNLSVLVGAPRWFYEVSYLQRAMGAEFHAQHEAVVNFEENVVQPVRRSFKENNPWIESAPCIIPLPQKCHVGDAQWRRGYFLSANAPDPGGMTQYNWVTFVKLKTTKTYELRNAGAAVVDFAAGGAL